MYRGPSNGDYHRAPVPQSQFGLPSAPYSESFGPSRFCPPFRGPPGPGYCGPPPGPPPLHLQPGPYGTVNDSYRESFYENRPFTSHTDQSGSTISQHQLGHSSKGWSTQMLDQENQEVRKKAEEFLRILESGERIELGGDKNESVDRTADKHPTRARSRSRGKSRPRSRSRSRGKSRARSRARSRSRSRGKSRARSRTRSRSRSRAKSRTRAKSRPRSRSRSRGRSVTRSKSQPRKRSPTQSKNSYRDTTETSHSSSSGPNLAGGAMPDLFHGLRQFLQSKDLEKHLPLVRSALGKNQSADDTRETVLGNHPAVTGFQNPMPRAEPDSYAGRSFGSLLPHERAGGDRSSFPGILSWTTPIQPPETKPVFHSVDDEEKFLYGEEEEKAKPQGVTVPLAQTISVRSPIQTPRTFTDSPYFNKEHQTHNLQDAKGPHTTPSVQPTASGTTKVTPEECEKVKGLLKTIGLNLGMADICKMAARLKEKKEEQGGASSLTPLKPALEVLQALPRAKTDDSRSNRSGSSQSNREPKREEKKTDQKERERREKQIQKKRKEYLVKELEGLLKQEGSGDLIPVMGFFCQRCEEFFGDLSSAERHVACHGDNDKNKTVSQDQHRDAKRHEDHRDMSSYRRESPASQGDRSSRVHQDHREHSPDRKRIKEERSPHSSDIKLKQHPEDKDKDKSKDKSKEKHDDGESTKSEKKKNKKEKKLKKKEKKKKKEKEKKKAEADKDSP